MANKLDRTNAACPLRWSRISEALDSPLQIRCPYFWRFREDPQIAQVCTSVHAKLGSFYLNDEFVEPSACQFRDSAFVFNEAHAIPADIAEI